MVGEKGKLVFFIEAGRLVRAEHISANGVRRRFGGAPIGCDIVTAAQLLMDQGEDHKYVTELIDTAGEPVPWPRQLFAN